MDRKVVGTKRKLSRGHPDDGDYRVHHRLECGHKVPAHPLDTRKVRFCKQCAQAKKEAPDAD